MDRLNNLMIVATAIFSLMGIALFGVVAVYIVWSLLTGGFCHV